MSFLFRPNDNFKNSYENQEAYHQILFLNLGVVSLAKPVIKAVKIRLF